MQEDGKVDSFVEYCRTHINPFTNKPYEIARRTVYQYIEGNMQFPVDLLIPLVSWSNDAKLMAGYNIMLPLSDNEKFMKKIEEKESMLRAIHDDIALMKSRIR